MDANIKSREELLNEINQLRQENSVLQTKLTNSKNGNFFKQLTEITSTLYIIYQEDRILFVNTAATELLGYSEEEFLQAKFMDFIHPDFQKIEKGNRLSLETGEKDVANFELKIRTKNNTECWFEFNIQPFKWNNKPAFIGSANDITERKKNEEELLKFKLCIERSFEAIFITDVEGNIIFINPAFEQMYGFSSVEAIGKTPRIFKSGSYQEGVYQYFWKTLLSKEAATGEIINKTKDGKLITVEGFNTSILDSKGDIYGYIGIHRDITERKTVEESLKLFRTLIDNSYDSFEVVDPITGRFLDVNETGCKELGYSREKFLKLSIFDIDPIVSPQSFAEIVKKLRKSGFLTWEGIHKRKDGTSFPVEVNIRIVNLEKEYMVTVVRNISLRKQNEELVLKLSRAVEQSPTSVIITDKNGVIEYVNPKLTEVTGYKKEEVLGKNPRIFSSGEKPKSDYKILWENIISGKVWKGELHNKKKNGELYWEYASISPIINTIGEITHFVAIKEDITLRKQTEKELIIAKEKAEESDRLKSAFLANMSHEIRTPMNGILGFADLLKNPNLTGEKQQNYIRIIEKSGARMLNIINDIVSISIIESGLMEVNISESNINEQIEYIYTFFKPEIESKGIQFLFKNPLPFSKAIIKTDRKKLFAILTNLVKNAIKYSEKGSIELGYDKKDEYFEFYVKDSGIGIDSTRQEAIFERFIQADISDKHAYQGAGLGLSISKAYVEMLGGKLWVESEKGIGSTFYFTIPYTTELKETVTHTNDNVNGEMEVQVRNLKILIVDDDKISDLLLSIMLTEISREILHAKSGLEAIELCRNNPDTDLIFMDIKMPGMNGYEATRQIRQFNKDVIVIAQTAYGLAGDREKAIEAGCNDHLLKPIIKNKLMSLIQQYFIK